MAKRFRRIAVAAAGVVAATGLALPAVAAQAATGYTPSPSEWWMANWSVPQEVWPLNQGSGVTVGVVGSGVQSGTPDLSGAVLSGADMVGDSGNGEQDYAPSPGHDTFVAEMIAGQGIAGGPVGIAPQAKILPIHVSSRIKTPSLAAAAIPDAIKYAVDHGAGVINLSIGNAYQSADYCPPTTQAAVSYALAHNVVVVAAAGDINVLGPGPVEPASCAGVLAVSGVQQNGELWKDSTRQPYVSVAAPGENIVIQGADGRSGTADGTSYSAPLVAGVAALIRSEDPSMPWYQVDQRIIDTAIPVKPVPNDGYGYGIMDVAKAVNTSSNPVSASAPNPPYTRYLAWLKTPNGQTWAQQNGVSSPSSGSNAAPSTTSKSGSGSAAPIAIGVVIVLLLAGGALALILRSRRPR